MEELAIPILGVVRVMIGTAGLELSDFSRSFVVEIDILGLPALELVTVVVVKVASNIMGEPTEIGAVALFWFKTRELLGVFSTMLSRLLLRLACFMAETSGTIGVGLNILIGLSGEFRLTL